MRPGNDMRRYQSIANAFTSICSRAYSDSMKSVHSVRSRSQRLTLPLRNSTTAAVYGMKSMLGPCSAARWISTA